MQFWYGLLKGTFMNWEKIAIDNDVKLVIIDDVTNGVRVKIWVARKRHCTAVRLTAEEAINECLLLVQARDGRGILERFSSLVGNLFR